MRIAPSTRLALLIGFAAGLALTLPAAAAVFVVDSAEDSGEGTLREAIGLANATPGPHTISIQVPGTNVALNLLSALPAITSSELSITATDSPGFRIDGQTLHRIFETSAGNQSLELIDLQLRRGKAARGACVLGHANAEASLRFERVRFEACAAEGSAGEIVGGAVFQPQGASLEVAASAFLDNSAIGPSAAGGAIATTAASIDVRDSRFERNTALGNGGNSSSGGALAFGLPEFGNAFLKGNRFIDNSVDGVQFALGGAVSGSCAQCVIRIEQGYFGGNSARNGGALSIFSAAMQPSPPALSLENLSFERNVAGVRGGAIELVQFSLDARNLSLQRNRAPGGGHLAASGSVVIERFTGTVLAATDASAGGTTSSCDFTGSNVQASGPLSGNLFAESPSCGALAASGAQPIASNQLGSLDAANGLMPVLVFGLASGVIDTLSNCPAQDARDTERPIDGNGDGEAQCDIGAYEHPASTLIFRNGFEEIR